MHSVQNYHLIESGCQGLDQNCICFSKPYHQIAGKEKYRNHELNKVLAKNIYNNVKNNYPYLIHTQYSPSNKYKRNLQRALENNKDSYTVNFKRPFLDEEKQYYSNNLDTISEKVKTKSTLKNNEDCIEIHHRIPTLNSEEILQVEEAQNKEKLKQNEETMYKQRFNEYPPMNGYGYNSMMQAHQGTEYGTSVQKHDLSNCNIQQHNIHGQNDMMFEDGNIPYGFYDQTNFSGNNTLMCGKGPINHNQTRIPRRESSQLINPYINDYSNRMGNGAYNYCPQYSVQNSRCLLNPHTNKNNMRPTYYQETNYCAGGISPKYKTDASLHKKESKKDDIKRRNLSKLKRGNIDINIETSSSSRKGVSIDLNIGV